MCYECKTTKQPSVEFSDAWCIAREPHQERRESHHDSTNDDDCGVEQRTETRVLENDVASCCEAQEQANYAQQTEEDIVAAVGKITRTDPRKATHRVPKPAVTMRAPKGIKGHRSMCLNSHTPFRRFLQRLSSLLLLSIR